jgi:hypothetical protein
MESKGSVFCKIYKLVHKHKVTGPDLLAQRADSGGGEDMSTTFFFKRMYIRPEIDPGRIYGMVFTVAGRITVSTPSIFPMVRGEEGLPYGVFTFFSFLFFIRSGSSIPEPPIMPTLILAIISPLKK